VVEWEGEGEGSGVEKSLRDLSVSHGTHLQVRRRLCFSAGRRSEILHSGTSRSQ
jgi:hypothetical protein